MKIKNQHNKIVLFTSLLLFLGMSCQQEKDLTFSDWDKDGNDLISKQEFKNVFTRNYYDDWDNTDDDHLDDEDFFRSVYYIWDEDADDRLSKEEWIMGFDYYYGDYVIYDYMTVDVDNDGYIEYAEYKDVINPTAFYQDWDKDNDGNIDEEELATGVFEIWDMDNSKFIEMDEYIDFDSYYLDI